jgi:hypothetical protein
MPADEDEDTYSGFNEDGAGARGAARHRSPAKAGRKGSILRTSSATSLVTLQQIIEEANHTAILPWPASFPEMVGLSVIKHDAALEEDPEYWGTGLDVRSQEITDFTWHPDPEQYPNLARFKIKINFLEMPADADEAARSDVGLQATSRFYVAVDRDSKTMSAIGFEGVEAESTTDPKDPFGYNLDPMADPAGEWHFHLPDKSTDMQFLFNADNTVLRNVNFGDPIVRSTGDWTMNCKFNIAKPVATGILTPNGVRIGNLINPSPPDLIQARLSVIKEYLAADASMFRSPVAVGKRTIFASIAIETITQVDTQHERFGASVAITFEWQVEKHDTIEHGSSPLSQTAIFSVLCAQ